jgi:hypothetical protein
MSVITLAGKYDIVFQQLGVAADEPRAQEIRAPAPPPAVPPNPQPPAGVKPAPAAVGQGGGDPTLPNLEAIGLPSVLKDGSPGTEPNPEPIDLPAPFQSPGTQPNREAFDLPPAFKEGSPGTQPNREAIDLPPALREESPGTQPNREAIGLPPALRDGPQTTVPSPRTVDPRSLGNESRGTQPDHELTVLPTTLVAPTSPTPPTAPLQQSEDTRWILELRNRLGEVSVHTLSEGSYMLGRSADAEIQVPSMHASGRHASLTIRAGQVSLRDLGSRYGTFVNDQKVEAGREIEITTIGAFRLADVTVKLSRERKTG